MHRFSSLSLHVGSTCYHTSYAHIKISLYNIIIILLHNTEVINKPLVDSPTCIS